MAPWVAVGADRRVDPGGLDCGVSCPVGSVDAVALFPEPGGGQLARVRERQDRADDECGEEEERNSQHEHLTIFLVNVHETALLRTWTVSLAWESEDLATIVIRCKP